MIRTVLRIAGILETASLLALIVNLVATHQQAFAEALGPIHGIVYVAVVVLSMLTPVRFSRRLLGFIPGIGGLLVVRSTRKSEVTNDPPSYW